MRKLLLFITKLAHDAAAILFAINMVMAALVCWTFMAPYRRMVDKKRKRMVPPSMMPQPYTRTLH